MPTVVPSYVNHCGGAGQHVNLKPEMGVRAWGLSAGGWGLSKWEGAWSLCPEAVAEMLCERWLANTVDW